MASPIVEEIQCCISVVHRGRQMAEELERHDTGGFLKSPLFGPGGSVQHLGDP